MRSWGQEGQTRAAGRETLPRAPQPPQGSRLARKAQVTTAPRGQQHFARSRRSRDEESPRAASLPCGTKLPLLFTSAPGTPESRSLQLSLCPRSSAHGKLHSQAAAELKWHSEPARGHTRWLELRHSRWAPSRTRRRLPTPLRALGQPYLQIPDLDLRVHRPRSKNEPVRVELGAGESCRDTGKHRRAEETLPWESPSAKSPQTSSPML